MPDINPVQAAIEAFERSPRPGVWPYIQRAELLADIRSTVLNPFAWISYLGNLRIDDGVWYQHDNGHICFDCYSWGHKYFADLGKVPFEDYMWGAVTGY